MAPSMHTLAGSPDAAACRLAAACVVSLASSGGSEGQVSAVPLAPVARFHALERLHAERLYLAGSADHLWGLTRLRSLKLDDSFDSGSFAGLSRLSCLDELQLGRCSSVAEVARALASLASLTSLAVSPIGGGIAANWRQLTALSQLEELALDCLADISEVAPLFPALSPRLRSLWLTAEGLPDVPAQLSACSGLTNLMLQNSNSFVGPAAPTAAGLQALASLTGLQQLALRWHCTLSGAEACSALAALPALTSIELAYTLSSDGWQGLSSLRHLRTATLEGCKLPGLSPLLGLASLMRLDLSSNFLNAVAVFQPGAVAAHHMLDTSGLETCTQLRELSFEYCKQQTLPASLSVLQGLTALNLSGNTLGGGWEHLRPLQLLARLDLHYCHQPAVPASLSTLTLLTHLNLSSNRIGGGWDHLRPLQQLACLKLSDCSLVGVPSGLSVLTSLTHLDLRHSSIQSGWEHLQPLTQLHEMLTGWL
ncbi:hypothetical protein ABPG75_009485 [Micractinium tetrahymenae]